MPERTYESLPLGITRIDAGYMRKGLACCYLMVEKGRAAFFDTGTTLSAPILMEVLAASGVTPADVDFVVPTHVHLDHAGGSGRLMELCPNARLVVHPRGARHLIEPSRLVAGSTSVYGNEGMKNHFGEVIPVPAERVIEAEDGYRFELAGRGLQILDTPGHALHHFCVFDSRSRGFFTGDTFGLCYPELRTEKGSFVFPPSTPSQFDPDSWCASLERLMSFKPAVMYTTHFGPVTDVEHSCRQLRRGIGRYAELAKSHAADGDLRTARLRDSIRSELFESLTQHGSTLSHGELDLLLGMDLDLNVQGLEIWLDRLEKGS